MDCRTASLSAVIALQLFSAADEVRSVLTDDDKAVVGYMQTVLTNAVNVISSLLTAAYSARLRRVRRSLDRVERSVQQQQQRTTADERWHVRYRAAACSVAAVTAFGYLKYGQLAESDGGENAFATAVVALLRTASAAGNYYVTAIFVDHVFLAKRVLWKLNARITDTVGSALSTGFAVSSARLAYLDVCDGCKTVTRAFQTQLFINVVANVFSVTFMMLSAFNALISDGTDTIRITLYFLYDPLLRTLQMYFIINACHTTVEQANSISITFQKKINEHYQINFTKRKVQLFILEMSDRKIEFILYGFICLDFEMFVSIMGTIATYLLILVQLGSSPDVVLDKTPNANVTKMSTTPNYITTPG